MNVHPRQTESSTPMFELVYDELLKLAEAKFRREGPGHILQPAALVHEAYLRLIGTDAFATGDRSYFFAAAARAMWQILVDRARNTTAKKRGGHLERIELTESTAAIDPPRTTILALTEALSELAQVHPEAYDIITLRFFAGCSVEESATILNISGAIAKRDWNLGKAWLRKRLT